MKTSFARAALFAAAFTACSSYVPPPEQPPPAIAEEEASPPVPGDSILLTVFLRHDQSKSLAEIQQLQEEQGFWKAFPPAGTAVVSWHVVMGIGQVVTLRVPAAKLRDVNVALEKTAWKAFRTEYYATYDLWPVIAGKLPNAIKEGASAPTSAQPATVATEAPAPAPTPSATATAPPTPKNPTTVKPPAPGERPKAPPVPTTPGADPLFDGRK